MGIAIGLIEKYILNRAPKFLRGPNAGRFLKSFALALDGNHEALRIGLTFDNPLLCPRECLPTIAKDRGLRMYPSEPEAGTRVRLSKWLQLHRMRASHQGVMRHVQPYFLPGPVPTIRIFHQAGDGSSSECHTLEASGRYSIARATPSNFDYSGDTASWGKWFMVIDATDANGVAVPALTAPRKWDDGCRWDEDGVRWNGFTAQTGIDLAAMAQDWKRAGTRMEAAMINRMPGTLDATTTWAQDGSGWTTVPNGNWGSPVSGQGDPTRPPYLQWFYTYS